MKIRGLTNVLVLITALFAGHVAGVRAQPNSPDPFEPNNSAATAQGPGTLPTTYEPLNIFPAGDVDYFTFVVPAGGVDVRIEIVGTTWPSYACPGALVLRLIGVDGATVLGQSTGGGVWGCPIIDPNVHAFARGLPPGTYFVSVQAADPGALIDSFALSLRQSTGEAQPLDEIGWNWSSENVKLTYQGLLTEGGIVVNGPTDMRFTLWSDPWRTQNTSGASLRLAGPVEHSGVLVQDGKLTALVKFDGLEQSHPSAPAVGTLKDFLATYKAWMQAEVRRPAGTGTWVVLGPRQEITQAPLAAAARLSGRATRAFEAEHSTFSSFSYSTRGLATTDPPAVPGLIGVVVGPGNTGSGAPVDPRRLTVQAPPSGNSEWLSFRDKDFNLEWYFRGTDSLGGDLRLCSANDLARLTVNQNGDVGIGTTTPAFLLEVNGTAGKPGGGSWATSSDARLKKNVQTLDHSLDRLLALRGVTFEYIDPAKTNERPGVHAGMIAQEVEQVFPEWVYTAPDGYRRLGFSGFEALTVEAMRDLRNEMTSELRARDEKIAELERQLQALRRLVEELRESPH